jgi:hypothetical protein
MSPECIAAGVRYAFPGAVAPFAAVLLLSRSDVVFVQMLNQLVHVLQIARLAILPLAHGHLILAELIEILYHARMVVW